MAAADRQAATSTPDQLESLYILSRGAVSIPSLRRVGWSSLSIGGSAASL
jgi:hypothetical protein